MKKIKIKWSCGVIPFCEHRTKLGAWLHIWFSGIKAGGVKPRKVKPNDT